MDMTARIEVSGPLLTGKGPAIVQKQVERFVTEAVLFLTREVKQRTPQGVGAGKGGGAQGGLMGSIKHEPAKRIGNIVRGSVETAQAYGEVIERGRRPGRGWPPRGALLNWVMFKFGLSPREAQRVEYLVRRKIARKGFEGAHMFEKALSENVARLQAMAQRRGLAMVVEMGA